MSNQHGPAQMVLDHRAEDEAEEERDRRVVERPQRVAEDSEDDDQVYL